MFSKFIGKFGFAIGCLLALLILVSVTVGSWIITCGLVYLITLCFKLTFSWQLATGIWLLIFLLKTIFGHDKSGE